MLIRCGGCSADRQTVKGETKVGEKQKPRVGVCECFFLIICEIFGRADGDEEKEVKADGDRSQ